MPGGDDSVGISDDGAVVEKDVDVVLRCQCADVAQQHEVRLVGSLDGFGDLAVGAVDPEDVVQEYIGALAPEQRLLFDRLHRLVLEMYPAAEVVLSYKIPAYKVGRRRLFVGGWKHGLSIYG